MPCSRRHLLAAWCGWALPSLPLSAAAPRLALPSVWSGALDPAEYLVSEKYDGVRGHWDGKRLRFRSGRSVAAPEWFTARLPREPLDGELWLGRGRFDALSGIVRKEVPVDADWQALRYVVFELPQGRGGFSERAEQLAGIVRRIGWPQLQAAGQTRVSDAAALERLLAKTVAGGGEGLVLHRASAPYVTGRTEAIFKLKPQRDAEATVVGYRPGRGKYAGQIGALELRAPDGRRFHVGSGLSDALRLAPPPLGSVVTYRYRDFTSTGLPRFASFVRIDPRL